MDKASTAYCMLTAAHIDGYSKAKEEKNRETPPRDLFGMEEGWMTANELFMSKTYGTIIYLYRLDKSRDGIFTAIEKTGGRTEER